MPDRDAERCGCENLACDHDEHPCRRPANPAKRLMYVGAVCGECHANMPAKYHIRDTK